MEENRNKGLFPGLLSLLLTGCILIFAFLYISDINTRLTKLDRITSNHSSELSEVRAWAFPASMLEGKFTSLNARMQALTDAFITLEDRIKAVSVQQQAVITASMSSLETAAGVPAARAGTSSQRLYQPVTRTSHEKALVATTVSNKSPSTTIQEPVARANPGKPAVATANTRDTTVTARVAGAMISDDVATGQRTAPQTSKTGPWAINLISSRRKADTERLAARAKSRDVPVEQTRATVKGKEYWRLQVTGFTSAREARSYANTVTAKLGLKDYWILKR